MKSTGGVRCFFSNVLIEKAPPVEPAGRWVKSPPAAVSTASGTASRLGWRRPTFTPTCARSSPGIPRPGSTRNTAITTRLWSGPLPIFLTSSQTSLPSVREASPAAQAVSPPTYTRICPSCRREAGASDMGHSKIGIRADLGHLLFCRKLKARHPLLGAPLRFGFRF